LIEQHKTYIDLLRDYFHFQQNVYGEEILLDKPVHLLFQTEKDRSEPGLSLIEEKVMQCSRCSLHKGVHKKVFGEGSKEAKLLIVGEAPGREEDLQGKPFVGKAGELLTKILKAIDFTRDEVYICNILKCRPPQNRDPDPQEIKMCFPFLEEQISVIKPEIILALGRFAGQALLNTQSSLARLRNEIHQYKDIPVFVTYHPAALLRDAKKKYDVWEDVQRLRKAYDNLVGDKPEWQPGKK